MQDRLSPVGAGTRAELGNINNSKTNVCCYVFSFPVQVVLFLMIYKIYRRKVWQPISGLDKGTASQST